jgi:tetratricopeptide (TPR) repeat protein
VGRSREIIGLVAAFVTLLAMGVVVAQDATWKDCELAARDPDRSIAACSKLLKGPSSRAHAAAYHHRGQAFAAKGNLDQAISDISAGIRLDSKSAYRWQARGELYARQGKYQQAITDFTEAIRKDPTPRAFRFQSRAEAYQGLGDLTRAIADYDEAIRLDTEARWFRFYARANALRDAGQYDRALVDYGTALKLEPTKAWVLVDRGRTYAKMGRPEAARNDFDSALRLDPANEQKLRPIIEAEVAALSGQSPLIPSPPSQQSPPQSPPLQQPAPARSTEDITYAEIGWWSIDYVYTDNWVGCNAIALFKGETLLSMTLFHTPEGEKGWFISISNPAWKSWIKKKKQHMLRLVTTKTWQSTFFVSADQATLYSIDLSIEFMNSIADAKSLEIFNEKNQSLASLDMKDSTKAIKAVVNCASEHARLVAEAQTEPQEETTVASGTGFFVAPNLLITNNHVIKVRDHLCAISEPRFLQSNHFRSRQHE